MVTKVQHLRSNVAGVRPTGRFPGELFVNFADKQLGIVDPTNTAVDLVAVRFHSTTSVYAVGAYVVQAGVLYCALVANGPGSFSPADWSKVTAQSDDAAALAAYLPLIGGTLSGALLLFAAPTQPLEAATKAYADLKLALAGGTMLGPLVLAADPVAALGAATKQTVDARVLRAGDTMLGPLILAADPVAALGAATKQTVDGKVAKAGDTMTGTLTILSADPTFNLNKSAAGQLAAITGYTNGSVRWQLRLGDNVAESGGNAGSNFALARYSDAGGSLGTVFSIDRASGAGSFAQPLSVAAPTAAGHAVTKAYVDGLALPAGIIMPFAGAVNAVPAGWFACNGQNINRNANLNLYNLFLNMTGGLAVWGAGDGSTTFGIPDLRGRVPAGIDDMGTGAAGLLKTGTLGVGGFASVGLAGFGGEQMHTPVVAEQFAHNHNHNHAPTGGGSFRANNAGGANYITQGTVQNAGASMDQDATGNAGALNQAHNNTQPTLLVNYIIRGG